MMQWILSSSVLIAVVIVLRYCLRGKISLRMQYALWLLVLVRLLVPVSFGTSDLSVMNAVPERRVQQSMTIPTENIVTPAAPLAPAQSTDVPLPSDFAQNTTVTDTAPKAEKTDWSGIAKTVWLTGVAVLGLTFLASNLRFARKLRRSRRSIAGTGASLPVYESAETETPCLFGLLKPSIYITPDTCADADTLRYVLAHEQTHYRHSDHLWAVLRGVCLALHWYNPLVWWASELSRRDAELACDEATIHTLGEAERAAYGRTLIRMTSEQRPALLVTATMMTDSGKGLRERITLLVKKPKTAVCTAALVLLIAGLSVACTFTGGKNDVVLDVELTDPFGREYETAEIVGCSPYYTDFTDMQMGILALANINAEGTRTVTLSNGDSRCEYETVTEITLTREDFDARFKSKTDGPTEWLDKSLSAAKLRRNNAKAWLCTSTAADESGWANRVYLLQQKDGTLYLVMAEEQEPSEYYPNGRNYACFVHRLNEEDSPTDFIQWCGRFRSENVTNLSISVDGAAALGYTGETRKSMTSELEPLLRALTGGQRVQLPDADAFDSTICLMTGDNKDAYMLEVSADGNYVNTIHVLGAFHADGEGKYFRPEAYYDAPWIASWIRAKAIPLLEGNLPEAETMLPLGEDTYEDDAGLVHAVETYRGEFPGGTRLTVGTFELPEGAMTFSGAWSPSYASVCAIVKPSNGSDGAVIYFKPGESVSLDFGQSGSCDIVLLAPKEGIDGTVQIEFPA